MILGGSYISPSSSNLICHGSTSRDLITRRVYQERPQMPGRPGGSVSPAHCSLVPTPTESVANQSSKGSLVPVTDHRLNPPQKTPANKKQNTPFQIHPVQHQSPTDPPQNPQISTHLFLPPTPHQPPLTPVGDTHGARNRTAAGVIPGEVRVEISSLCQKKWFPDTTRRRGGEQQSTLPKSQWGAGAGGQGGAAAACSPPSSCSSSPSFFRFAVSSLSLPLVLKLNFDAAVLFFLFPGWWARGALFLARLLMPGWCLRLQARRRRGAAANRTWA
jgi:hypothetical protein